MVVKPPNLEHRDELSHTAHAARHAAHGLWRFEEGRPRDPNQYIGDNVSKYMYPSTSQYIDDIPRPQRVAFRTRVAASAKGYKLCPRCRDETGQQTDLC